MGKSFASVLIAAALFVGCSGHRSTPEPDRRSVIGSMTEDGQWTLAAKDYANTRYSALDQINTGNVNRLKVAWMFSTGLRHGHEAAPLVIGDMMYVVTPFPNVLYALDAQNGQVKWKYHPKPLAAAQGVACCDVVNRGAAYADRKIIFNTLDNRTVAVDARSGSLDWETRLGDINLGETMTMAPFVVKDTVLVGNSGGELGVRGWLCGLDLNSGKVKWRAYSTGPDNEVLIGPSFKPFYASDQGKDLGVSTWPKDAWKVGGGTVWGWISYDPEADLVYYGTANPGPWNPHQRPGDNKWTSGIFARDPDNGEARWFYQWSPHDVFDHDGINEQILLNLAIGGRERKVLVRPERNGYVYVMDRLTGEVLSATPFVHNTTSTGVDLKTGRLLMIHEKTPQIGKYTEDICPASPGAKDWTPAAWSPKTKLMYMPHNNLCQASEAAEVQYIAGTPFVGMNVKMYAGPGGNRGFFTAWDVLSRKAAWQIPEKWPVWSGAVVTAGDVVFYGTMEGLFKALDARTGDLKWQFQAGSGVVGQPVSYRGADGKQYIAVFAGVGGWAGAIVSGGLDPRDPTAALGFVGATTELPNETTPGGVLYVFSLP